MTPPPAHDLHLSPINPNGLDGGDDALVEKVARALHNSREALPADVWVDAELTPWDDSGDLWATVDGNVNFSAIARVIIPIVRSYVLINEDALTVCYMKGVEDGRDAERDDVVACLRCWSNNRTADRIAANAHREKRT